MVGGTAEVMERRRLQRKVGLADYLTAIEILQLLLELESTALQQQNFEGCVGKFASDGDAGRSGADDAEIALEDRPVIERSGVGVQGSRPLRRGKGEERSLSRFG